MPAASPASGCRSSTASRPETAYPGPLDDCYAGLRWTYEHAAELGIDPDRIGIAGVSAGGGLAAALALLARDRGEVPVAFQLLECPMIDDRQTTSSSQLDGLADLEPRVERVRVAAATSATSTAATTSPPTRRRHAPTDLSGLPPALVIVGGADGFRDEDIDYALRLNQAGVPTELHVLPGAPHGVQMFADSVVARRWNRIVVEWLGLQLRAS